MQRIRDLHVVYAICETAASLCLCMELFRSQLISNILKEVDGANEPPLLIENRCRKRSEGHSRSIRTLRHSGYAANWSASFYRNRHRTLIVWQILAGISMESPCHTPAVPADFGSPTGEIYACWIEISDQPFFVGDINGRRQLIERVLQRFFAAGRRLRRPIQYRINGKHEQSTRQMRVDSELVIPH
jgi:hypothetical protein